MSNHLIFFIILIIIIGIFALIPPNNNINEYMANTEAVSNNEAISNVSSLYNTSEMTVTNLNVTGTFNLLPKGIILTYNGATAPAGWAICDGTNGTPDLRGRFIRMWNNDDGDKNNSWKFYSPNIVVGRDYGQKDIVGAYRGGQFSAILPHTLGDQGGTDHQILNINEIATHNHTSTQHTVQPAGWWQQSSGWITSSDRNNWGHDYSFTTDNSGGGAGHNNMPPYYVLTYIMKL